MEYVINILRTRMDSLQKAAQILNQEPDQDKLAELQRAIEVLDEYQHTIN